MKVSKTKCIKAQNNMMMRERIEDNKKSRKDEVILMAYLLHSVLFIALAVVIRVMTDAHDTGPFIRSLTPECLPHRRHSVPVRVPLGRDHRRVG